MNSGVTDIQQAEQKAKHGKLRVAVYLECDTDVGGQYQYALSIVRALELRPDLFDIYCYSSRSVWKHYSKERSVHYRPFPMSVATSRMGQRLVRRHLANHRPPSWVGRLLRRRLFKDRIDTVIFPLPTALVGALGGATSIPSITTIHDLVYRYVPELREEGHSSTEWYDDLYQYILTNSSTVLTDSEVCANQLRETFPAATATANIQVLPYCAPPYVNEYLREMKRNPQIITADISKEVRDATAKPFIFSPASFTRHKNHDRLLQALRQLADEGLIVNAVFSGPPWPPQDELKSLIAKYDLQAQTTVLSYVSNYEVCHLYSQAQALVMPTFNGPTNLPPLEAFALGCPVVISDIFKESDQLRSGVLLFDPRSSEDIARAIRKIVSDEDLRSELIEAGHQRDKELNLEAFSTRLTEIVSATAAGGNDDCGRT